ncbi:MAG: hypothetical protein J6Y17_03510 [Elusimicrobiaceae bacterium]|nr:hypothetical protein [Elusimicrobiaceae bacterium]
MRVNQMVLSILIGLGLICLFLCFLALKPALNSFHKMFAPAKDSEEVVQKEESSVPLQKSTWGDDLSVEVRPLVALSGVSKQKVFALRKQAVASSPFARQNYEPSSEVFGGIVSGKPWMAATACSDPKTRKHYTQGLSEETRFINNPTALVMLEMPFVFPSNANWCTREDANLLPHKITYDALRGEITLTYLALPFQTRKDNTFYAFNGLNARDLGYPYIYVDPNRSTYLVEFLNKDNVSTEVVKLQNYLHVGPSCGARGGCNNGSPRQPMLEFHEDISPDSNGKEIYIKLWKEKPNNVNDTADIVERIIIGTSEM